MKRLRVITFLVLLGFVAAFVAGCATDSHLTNGLEQSIREDKAQYYWAVLAVSTPYHESDWSQLQKTLKAEGIACIEGSSSFGAADLLVDSREFERARRIGERLITGKSLTIRLSKDTHGGVLEVYENGKKIREFRSSYDIEKRN